MHKCAKIIDLERCYKMSTRLPTNIGLDTAEIEPSEVPQDQVVLDVSVRGHGALILRCLEASFRSRSENRVSQSTQKTAEEGPSIKSKIH